KTKVVPRAHPRSDPATLAQLLSAAGFAMPVVDVERIRLRYKDLDALIRDLRGMGATDVFTERQSPLSKSGAARAREAFAARAMDGRTEETVEILHFLGWTQQSQIASN